MFLCSYSHSLLLVVALVIYKFAFCIAMLLHVFFVTILHHFIILLFCDLLALSRLVLCELLFFDEGLYKKLTQCCWPLFSSSLGTSVWICICNKVIYGVTVCQLYVHIGHCDKQTKEDTFIVIIQQSDHIYNLSKVCFCIFRHVRKCSCTFIRVENVFAGLLLRMLACYRHL